MTTTPNITVTHLVDGQAQAEATANEAFDAFAVMAQCVVVDKDLATPPGSPVQGATYIVAASPTGAWVGHEKHLASYLNTAWVFQTPKEGWICYVQDENRFYTYNGTTWVALSIGAGGSPLGVKHRPSITIEEPSATEDITLFMTDVAITLVELNAVICPPVSGNSVTWTIRHASTRDAAGTEVVTGGTVTTASSTPQTVTSFNDATIPADSIVWLETTASNLTAAQHLNVTLTYTED